MFFRSQNKFEMINAASALPGRGLALRTANNHFLSGRPLKSEVPDGFHEAMFGMGCFWGVERMFWKLDGVWISMVGYAGGYTPNATYEEVCSGKTGHNEVVRLIFDPTVIDYADLLKVFWEVTIQPKECNRAMIGELNIGLGFILTLWNKKKQHKPVVINFK